MLIYILCVPQVDRQNLRDAQVPDPGAHGVGILLRGILGALEG